MEEDNVFHTSRTFPSWFLMFCCCFKISSLITLNVNNMQVSHLCHAFLRAVHWNSNTLYTFPKVMHLHLNSYDFQISLILASLCFFFLGIYFLHAVQKNSARVGNKRNLTSIFHFKYWWIKSADYSDKLTKTLAVRSTCLLCLKEFQINGILQKQCGNCILQIHSWSYWSLFIL